MKIIKSSVVTLVPMLFKRVLEDFTPTSNETSAARVNTPPTGRIKFHALLIAAGLLTVLEAIMNAIEITACCFHSGPPA